MKVFYTLFLMLVSVLLSGQEDPFNRGFLVSVGDQCPDFSLVMLDGDTLTQDNLRGKVVVLQFTASWCGVCRNEMPHLEKEVWKPNKDKDFLLIGVDYDESADKVQYFKEIMETTYPMALDPDGKIFASFAKKGSGVTRNVVINKQGEIVFLTRLFDKAEFNQMKVVIDSLLAE